LLSSSGIIRCANCLPSSTPHWSNESIFQIVPIELLFFDGFFGDVIKKKVRDIVSQRTTDEKFHRKVLNALRIPAFVGLLGLNPSFRKDIAQRAGDGFKTLAIADRRCFQNVVKDEVAFIERIVRPSELNQGRIHIFL